MGLNNNVLVVSGLFVVVLIVMGLTKSVPNYRLLIDKKYLMNNHLRFYRSARLWIVFRMCVETGCVELRRSTDVYEGHVY